MTKNPVTVPTEIDGNASRVSGNCSNANAANLLLVNVIAIAAILLAGAATISVALADATATLIM
jgi:hypothetical protein